MGQPNGDLGESTANTGRDSIWLGQPFHALLFAVAPFLFLVGQNADEVGLVASLPWLLGSLGAAIVMLGVLTRVLGDRRRAGLLTSMTWFFLFFYGHVYFAGRILPVLGPYFRDQVYLMTVWISGGAFLAWRLVGTKRDLRPVTGGLNTAAAVFVVVALAQIGMGQAGGDSEIAVAAVAHDAGASGPDVYHVVLDGYARADVLAHVFDYDNTWFLAGLEERGFTVLDEASSNYPLTFLSLASTLNMDYLQPEGAAGRNRADVYTAIERNAAMQSFAGRGYETVHVTSGWGPTDHSALANDVFRCGRFDEWTMTVLRTTILHPFTDSLFGNDHRARVECSFDQVAAVAARPGPTYTFAHMVTPHNPYVFGPNGEPRKAGDLTFDGVRWADLAGYSDQLHYINGRVLATIDAILAEDSDAVILLHADHGSAATFAGGHASGDYILGPDPTLEQLLERTSIMAAIRAPGPAPPADLTPVNYYRWVFNHTFGDDAAILEDRVFYARYDEPYEWTDVTERVRL